MADDDEILEAEEIRRNFSVLHYAKAIFTASWKTRQAIKKEKIAVVKNGGAISFDDKSETHIREFRKEAEELRKNIKTPGRIDVDTGEFLQANIEAMISDKEFRGSFKAIGLTVEEFLHKLDNNEDPIKILEKITSQEEAFVKAAYMQHQINGMKETKKFASKDFKPFEILLREAQAEQRGDNSVEYTPNSTQERNDGWKATPPEHRDDGWKPTSPENRLEDRIKTVPIRPKRPEPQNQNEKSMEEIFKQQGDRLRNPLRYQDDKPTIFFKGDTFRLERPVSPRDPNAIPKDGPVANPDAPSEDKRAEKPKDKKNVGIPDLNKIKHLALQFWNDTNPFVSEHPHQIVSSTDKDGPGRGKA